MIGTAGPGEVIEGPGLSADSHFVSFQRDRPVDEDRSATVYKQRVSQKNRLWRFWPFKEQIP